MILKIIEYEIPIYLNYTSPKYWAFELGIVKSVTVKTFSGPNNQITKLSIHDITIINKCFFTVYLCESLGPFSDILITFCLASIIELLLYNKTICKKVP